MQPAQPVHRPDVTTSSKRCFQCSFSGGMGGNITLRAVVPELPEVEFYRQLAEASALQRPILTVETIDPRYLRGASRGDDGLAETVVAALVGRRFVRARRVGKLALIDTDAG